MATIEYKITLKPAQPSLNVRLKVETNGNKPELTIKGESTDLSVSLSLTNTPASVLGAIASLGISQAMLTGLGNKIADEINNKLPDAVKKIDIPFDLTDYLTHNFDIGGIDITATAEQVDLTTHQGMLMLSGSLQLT